MSVALREVIRNPLTLSAAHPFGLNAARSDRIERALPKRPSLGAAPDCRASLFGPLKLQQIDCGDRTTH